MGRKKSYDREEVLRNAMGLFWRKGFEGAHLQELVEATGLNRFSLYSEFDSKDGLYREALDLYVTDLADLDAILTTKPLGLANILALFRAESRERFHHGCMALNVLVQKHVVNPDVFAKVGDMVANLYRRLRQNLQAAQTAGEVSPELECSDVARLITALNIGLLSYEMYATGKAPRRAVVRSLEQMLRAGAPG